MTREDKCIHALRETAQILGKSPTKAEYEEAGLQPAPGTIPRNTEGWNAAKEAASLDTFEQGNGPGPDPKPKPDDGELPDRESWDSLSAYQRWYYRNREQAIASRERRRQQRKRWFYEYKRDECGCAECGETHPAALDFHHTARERKDGNISQLVARGRPKEQIKSEMDKCVVLCANCHRKEHYEVPARVTDSSTSNYALGKLPSWTSHDLSLSRLHRVGC